MSSAPPDPRATARRKWLAVAGIATLAATLWAALQGDDSAPVGPAPARSPHAADGAGPRIAAAPTPAPESTGRWPAPPDAQGREPWHDALAQGLAAWSAPPPPPPPPAPSTAREAARKLPQAPPFPYTLIGRIDDGEPRALLSGPMRSFGVKASEVIDGQWRVDAILNNGLSLTWLPGSEKKTLTFAAS